MIDKTKRLEKEQAKAKTKKRIYVEVDPENYDYFPETRQADYYEKRGCAYNLCATSENTNI